MNLLDLEIYIAPFGIDGAPGSKDQPLASLTGCRELLRLRKRTGMLGQNPVTVWLRGGTYVLDSSFVLEAEDSLDVLVEYCAYPGEEVRISGGRALDPAAFQPVADPMILRRLDPTAVGKVLCYDLRQSGVSDPGTLKARGFNYADHPSEMELFIQDQPMPLSRWPKTGFLDIGAIRDPGTCYDDPISRGAVFICDDARATRWATAPDPLVFGSWYHDWAPSTMLCRVGEVETGSIALQGHSTYGVKSGKRFFIMNLIEEIGRPGEWYLDRSTGILYLWPPDEMAGMRIDVSMLEEPLIALRGVSRVTFNGLIFECARGIGVEMGGSDNVLSDCVLRNLGRNAVTVGGANNGVTGCDIYQTGQGGVFLTGGDRPTLTPAGNYACNNHIHDFNRLVRTYKPGILFTGVGQRASHNLVRQATHFGLYLHGNDHIIELNEICDVCLESDDAGAFYMGRNPSERGNVIRHNFFHHLGSGNECGTAGVYADDGASGLHILGNVFFRVGNRGILGFGAIYINSGKDQVIENNLFIECPRAVGVALTTQEGWAHGMSDIDHDASSMGAYYRKCLYIDVDITKPPFITRYPELARLKENASRNRICRNVVVRCEEFALGLERQDAQDNWLTDENPGFCDGSHLDFLLCDQAPVFSHIPAFEPVLFREMGLRVETFRHTVPNVRARVEVATTLVGRPEMEAIGSCATGSVRVLVENRSGQPTEGVLKLLSNQGLVTYQEPDTIPYRLNVDDVVDCVIPFTARPAHNHDLYLQASNPADANVRAFAQGVVQHRHTVPRYEAVDTLDQLGSRLLEQPPLIFRNDAGVAVAEWRLALFGDRLALLSSVDDSRAVPDREQWRDAEDLWQGPLVGLFFDAMIPESIRQLVFFPVGLTGGDIWYLVGPERSALPKIDWKVTSRVGSGYDLTALLPLAEMGLDPAQAFRLQGMVHVPNASKVLPLFGPITSYNDSRRFAIVVADHSFSRSS